MTLELIRDALGGGMGAVLQARHRPVQPGAVSGLANRRVVVRRPPAGVRTPGMRLLVLVSIAVTIPACGPDESLSSESVMVTDSAGVKIVSSQEGRWRNGDAWSVFATPRLTIGVLDGDEEYQFSNISAASRQADGDLVIADTGSRTVRLYNSDGVFKRLLGGPGSGPGEFQRPTQIFVLASDSILVWDDAAFRLTRFDAAGSLVGVHTFSREAISKAVAAPLYPGTAQLLSNSDLLVRLIEKSRGVPAKDSFRGRSGALLVSSDFAVIDTLMWFGDVEQVLVDAPWGRQPVVPPLARNTSIAVQPTGPRVCVGDQEGPEVLCFERDRPPTVLRWQGNPIPVLDDERDVVEWRETTLELYELKLTPEDARQLVDQVPEPPVRPEYSELVLDRGGNLWVKRGPGGPGNLGVTDYLVFDPTGELLGSLGMPPTRVLEIGPDYVLGVREDELEVEYFGVFTLVKPSTPVDRN